MRCDLYKKVPEAIELRRMRKKKRITVRKLSEMVGVRFSDIGCFEAGQRQMSDELLNKCFKALESL